MYLTKEKLKNSLLINLYYYDDYYRSKYNLPNLIKKLIRPVKLNKNSLDISWELLCKLKKSKIWDNHKQIEYCMSNLFFIKLEKLDEFIDLLHPIITSKIINYCFVYKYLQKICLCLKVFMKKNDLRLCI